MLFPLSFLALTSCLTIVQSLTTESNIITDNRLIGEWLDASSKKMLVQKLMDSKDNKIFTELDHKTYTAADSVFFIKHYVISFSENNLNYSWVAGMVKIKDQYYIDIEPDECTNKNGTEQYNVNKLVTASIAKLEWKNNNSVILHFLNGDYVKQIILNGQARIKHEYDPLFGTFIITASSDEMEQFLEKYGNNENLFSGGNTIKLTRKV